MLLSTYQFGSQSPMKRPPFADIPIDTCTDSHYIIPMLRRMEAPYPIPTSDHDKHQRQGLRLELLESGRELVVEVATFSGICKPLLSQSAAYLIRRLLCPFLVDCFHRDDRFPCGPKSSSRHLHAGHRLGGKTGFSQTTPDQGSLFGFDVIFFLSTLHRTVRFCSPP